MRILFTSAGGLGQYRPDLVVSECLEFAGSMVAERAGIPSVSAQIGSFAIDDPQAGPIIDELNHRRRSIGLPASDRLPWHSMPVANWLPELMRCAEPPLPFGRFDYRFEDAEGRVTSLPGQRPAPAGRSSVYVRLRHSRQRCGRRERDRGGLPGTADGVRAAVRGSTSQRHIPCVSWRRSHGRG